MKNVRFAFAALASACLLSACGGGGSSASNNASPSTTNSTTNGALPPGESRNSVITRTTDVNFFEAASTNANPAYTAFFAVLDSGEYYALAVDNNENPKMLVHGSFGSTNGTKLMSANLTSYDLQTNEALTMGTLSADYSQPQAPVFTALANGTNISFSTQRILSDETGQHPTMKEPLTLAQMAGAFTGGVYASGIKMAPARVSGVLGSDGSLTVQVGACQANINLSEASRPGVVRARMNIAGPQCELSGVTGGGIAIPTNYTVSTQGTVSHLGLNLLLLTDKADKAFTIFLNR